MGNVIGKVHKFLTRSVSNKPKRLRAMILSLIEYIFIGDNKRSMLVLNKTDRGICITNRFVLPLSNDNLVMPHIIISICEPHKDFVELPPNSNRLGLLQLKYTDDDREDEMNKGKLITEEHAAQVIDFVLEHRDKAELIICQCDGGVSRSSGTAAALSKIFNNDDFWVFKSTRYVPNMLVYRTILNVWHDKYSQGASR